MARTINNMLQAIRKIDLSMKVDEALTQSSAEYLRLQKNQMYQGERKDGEGIFRLSTGSKEYSPKYAIYKGKKQPIDLHDKGNFYNDMFAVPTPDGKGLAVGSADSKSEELQKTYGDEIFGLTKENKGEYRVTLKKEFMKTMVKAINVR